MSQLLRNEWKKETGTEEQDNLGILLIFKEQRSLTAVTDHTKKVVFFLLVNVVSSFSFATMIEAILSPDNFPY